MDDRKYLTAEEVAERYRGVVSIGTLRNWQAIRVGPVFVKIGKAFFPFREALGLRPPLSVNSTCQSVHTIPVPRARRSLKAKECKWARSRLQSENVLRVTAADVQRSSKLQSRSVEFIRRAVQNAAAKVEYMD
jgi:hypothetical protein